MKLPNYENDHYKLDNAEQLHKEYPDSFWIPDIKHRENLQSGELVKLIFRMEDKNNTDEVYVERMWVEIQKKENKFYLGILDNDPLGNVFIRAGKVIYFKAEHIIDIYEE